MDSAAKSAAEARLPKAVIGLGLVSLFTDISSEAIFPLLPAFLVSLNATSAFIGLVEGAAELLSNVLKYVVGRSSDRRERLKPLVLFGYGVSTLVRPLMALATSPWHVLLVRMGDRVGKGVRTSPRDALIAAIAEPSMRARAFGFHRAMDHAGAAIGTLLASSVLYALSKSTDGAAETARHMRTVFIWAALPGLFAMIALALVREPRRPNPMLGSAPAPALSAELRRTLLALTLFAFANATDAFILVRAARMGAAATLAPMLWLVLHVIKATTATLGGRLADRYGKRQALITGWLLYALVWTSLGCVGTLPWLFVLTGLYGITHGMVEGAERGLIADLSAGRARGAVFGAYNMLIGLAALASSASFGAVWDRFGSAVAFGASSVFALLAAGVLAANGRPHRFS